jgi:hypothetical protein
MSDKNVIGSNELVVRYEQCDDGSVNWLVQADEAVAGILHLSYDELARDGAPLSAIGTKALWELLSESMVVLALEKANGYLWKEDSRQMHQQHLFVQGDVEEGVIVH